MVIGGAFPNTACLSISPSPKAIVERNLLADLLGCLALYLCITSSHQLYFRFSVSGIITDRPCGRGRWSVPLCTTCSQRTHAGLTKMMEIPSHAAKAHETRCFITKELATACSPARCLVCHGFVASSGLNTALYVHVLAACSATRGVPAPPPAPKPRACFLGHPPSFRFALYRNSIFP